MNGADGRLWNPFEHGNPANLNKVWHNATNTVQCCSKATWFTLVCSAFEHTIQFVKNLDDKVNVLDERTQTQQEPETDAQTLDPAYGMGGMQPMLAIAPTAYNDPSAQYGMGMNPGMNMGMRMQPNMGMGGMQQNPNASSTSSMGSNPYGNSGYQY